MGPRSRPSGAQGIAEEMESYRSVGVAPVAPELAPVALVDAAPAPAPPVVRAAGTGRRALSLDALRGFFLLEMTLGFTIWEKTFPAWMYHRQFPPPTHELLEIAGLTWRDLAYPAFLFTMAAALPLTLGLRIERGARARGLLLGALERGLLLFFFALLIGHSSGYWIGEYTQTSQLLSLLGFALMFPLFTRRRGDWDPRLFAGLQRLGWVAAAAFLAFTPGLYGRTFSLARRDDIIAQLAFASVAGSLLWYATRRDLLARLAVLAGVVALSLAALAEGWVQTLWWGSPAPWLFEVSSLKLLAVVIPGTIAGDLLVAWRKAPEEAPPPEARWSGARLRLLACLGIAFTPLLVVGLTQRRVVETTLLAMGLCAGGLALVRRPASAAERAARGLYLWSAFWLVLGLTLEPFEGGIKKVPGTLSYYFALSGNTGMLLVALIAGLDLRAKPPRWARLLIDVGQNPMLCYVTFTLLLNPALDLIPPLGALLTGSPAELLLRSLLSVALVAVLVQQLTRRRIFWRT